MFSKKKPELVDNKAVVGKVSGSSAQKLTAPLKKVPKKWRITGLVVILVLLVGGGLIAYHQYQVHKDNQAALNESFTKSMKIADDLHFNGQDALAKTALTDFLSQHQKDMSDDQLQQIHSRLGAVYTGLGDTRNSAMELQAAIKLNPHPTFSDYYAVGIACYQAKEKDCTITYLNLASKKLESDKIKLRDWPTFKSVIDNSVKEAQGF